ncbi:MAG: porin family protein [Rhizobiales bacterium]|nr:porin family protein [Hyphomicrobiales bacterium]
MADVSFPNTIMGSAAVPGAPDSSTLKEAVQASGSVRARLGYAPGAWLFYATGGPAWTYNRSTLASVAAADGETHDLTRLGLAWGAGAELGLSLNWSARLEYLGTGFGSQGVTFSGAAQRVSSDWAVHTARLGFNYRFGRDDRKVLDEGVKPLENDWFNLRAQTTYLQQYAAPFRAPYRGTRAFGK